MGRKQRERRQAGGGAWGFGPGEAGGNDKSPDSDSEGCRQTGKAEELKRTPSLRKVLCWTPLKNTRAGM